jgi:hypothetical protein
MQIFFRIGMGRARCAGIGRKLIDGDGTIEMAMAADTVINAAESRGLEARLADLIC